MVALEPLAGLRVVAESDALDRARWSGDGPITVIRIAPDEAFAIGATSVEVGDDHAILESESGFSGARLDQPGLESVLAHVEFAVPGGRPALAQGKIAGVPAKLLLGKDGTLLLVQTAYVADLEARLW